VTSPPYTKPILKHKNLTSFFLRLKQILKAVLMGVVASIDFFGQTWPTQPHGGLGIVVLRLAGVCYGGAWCALL
jgi:hypothetical protein